MQEKSKRYKWVITTNFRIIYLKIKPKKVPGGYMDEYGSRYIGIDVTMTTREIYDSVFV